MQNGTFWKIYVWLGMNGLGEIEGGRGLDKISLKLQKDAIFTRQVSTRSVVEARSPAENGRGLRSRLAGRDSQKCGAASVRWTTDSVPPFKKRTVAHIYSRRSRSLRNIFKLDGQKPTLKEGIRGPYYVVRRLRAMKAPQFHLRNLDGNSIQAECTACPFPEVCFEARKGGSAEEIMSELQQQFVEHCQKVHEGAASSHAARGSSG